MMDKHNQSEILYLLHMSRVWQLLLGFHHSPILPLATYRRHVICIGWSIIRYITYQHPYIGIFAAGNDKDLFGFFVDRNGNSYLYYVCQSFSTMEKRTQLDIDLANTSSIVVLLFSTNTSFRKWCIHCRKVKKEVVLKERSQ